MGDHCRSRREQAVAMLAAAAMPLAVPGGEGLGRLIEVGRA